MSDTSERDAFIRAIIAEPDDDAPRLVFADWLDEHGEPERAEFIRVQCALAALPEGEQDAARSARSRDLIGRYSEKWLAELPALAGVRAIGFHRGFIQQIAFTNLKAFRLHVATVTATTPVHAVTFARLTPGTARSLADMPELAHVRSLTLRRSGADAPSLATLCCSPHLAGLRRLEVAYSPLDDEGLSSMAREMRLPRLRRLILPSNQFADRGAEALADARGLPTLHWLDLSTNRVGDAGAVALARSPHLGTLRHLDLSHCQVGGAGLAALVARTTLESVRLDYNPLGSSQPVSNHHLNVIGLPAEQRQLDLWAAELDDVGLAALVQCPGFETVTDLRLSGNPLSRNGLRALGDAPGPISLRRMTLYRPPTSPWTVETLLLGPRLGRLERFSVHVAGPGEMEPIRVPSPLSATVKLSVTGDPSALAWLAGSSSLRRVRSLSVRGSELLILIRSPHLTGLEELSVESASFAQVRPLVTATELRLKRLDLSYGKQGDRVAEMLAEIPHLAGLERLRMEYADVTDAGALALAASPSFAGLQRLDLQRNEISRDARRRLRERFGDGVLLSEPRGEQ